MERKIRNELKFISLNVFVIVKVFLLFKKIVIYIWPHDNKTNKETKEMNLLCWEKIRFLLISESKHFSCFKFLFRINFKILIWFRF